MERWNYFVRICRRVLKVSFANISLDEKEKEKEKEKESEA